MTRQAPELFRLRDRLKVLTRSGIDAGPPPASGEWSWLSRCAAAVRSGNSSEADALASLLDSGQEVAAAFKAEPYWPGARGEADERGGPRTSAARAVLSAAYADLDPARERAWLEAAITHWQQAYYLLPEEEAASDFATLVRRLLRGDLPDPDPDRSVRAAVVFGGRRGGSSATLTLAVQQTGPHGLFPNPRSMTFFTADDEFADSLAVAWHSAPALSERCVIWDISDKGQPYRSLPTTTGGSLGAAFGVALHDLAQAIRPLGGWRMRRLDPACAVTGELLYSCKLGPVKDYEQKFSAAADRLRVVAPDDPEARKYREIPKHVDFVTDLNAAIRKSRRFRPRRHGAIALTVFLVAALAIVTAAARAAQSGEHAAAAQEVQQVRARQLAAEQQKLRSAAGQLITQASLVSASNPPMALQLATAAYSILPSAETRAGLFNTLTSTPFEGTVRASIGFVTAAAYAPHRPVLAVASLTSVQLFNVAVPSRPRLLTTIAQPDQGHELTSIAFSPDGRVLATLGYGVDLIDVSDPAHAAEIGSQLDTGLVEPSAMAFSPNGRTLAILASDIELWNITNTAEPVQLSTYPEQDDNDYPPIAYSPDGNLLAIPGENHNTLLLNVANPSHPVMAGSPLDGHTATINAVTFLPGTHLIATASDDDTTIVWNISSLAHPRHVATLGGNTASVTALAASDDGKVLATGSLDSTVLLWNMTDPADPQQIGAPLPQPTGVSALAFSPDGDTLVSAGQGSPSALLWDVGPSPVRPEPLGLLLSVQAPEPAVAIAPGGQLLATSGPADDTRLWNISDPASPRAVADLGLAENALAFSPWGNLLAVASNEASAVSLFDVSSPARPAAVMLPVPPGYSPADGNDAAVSVAFAPDGRSIAAGTNSGELLEWSSSAPIGSGSPITAHYVYLPSPPEQPTSQNSGFLPQDGSPSTDVDSVAYSPDSHILAVGTDPDSLTLWNVTDPAQPHQIGKPLTGHTDGITSVAFSPNGTTLAAGSLDGTVLLWNVTDPARPAQISTPLTSHYEVTSIGFSADGSTLAVGSDNNGQTILWNVADPQQPQPIGDPLDGNDGTVTSLAYTPSGLLATASTDHTVSFWDESALATTYANTVQLACDEAGPLSRTAWRRYIPGLPYIQPCQPAIIQSARLQSPASAPYPAPSGSPAPSGQSLATPPFQRTAAQALAQLLATSASDRSAVEAAIKDVDSCGPGLSQDVNTFQRAASSLQALIGQFDSIPDTFTLPTQIIPDLSDAWVADQQEYAGFGQWAQDEDSVRGCYPAGDIANPSAQEANGFYQDAADDGGEATPYMQNLVGLWNPIATEYGLTTYKWNQL